MKRLGHHLLGIDQGQTTLFSDFQDGGAMWTGEGPREVRSSVTFSETFRDAPTVQVTLSMWDIASEANTRADISAEEVGPDGFTIVFRTWADTRVARIRVGWIAIGALRDDDDWDVDRG